MFSSIFNGQKKSNIVWINYSLYANRLFNSGKDNIWENTATFISVYKQAQTLLQSDMISIDTIPFYKQWIKTNENIQENFKELNPRNLIKHFFNLEEPKQRIVEVLKGIEHSYGNKIPIGLVIPSAKVFSEIVNNIFNIKLELNERIVNSFTMYTADFLRTFSENNITFIIINDIKENDKSYASVLNVSEHYDWEVGFLNKDTNSIYFSNKNVVFKMIDDLLSLEEVQLENNSRQWYVNISPNIEPEVVLDKIKLLKGAR